MLSLRWATLLLLLLVAGLMAWFWPPPPLPHDEVLLEIPVMHRMGDLQVQLDKVAHEGRVYFVPVNRAFVPMAHNFALWANRTTPPVTNVLYVALDEPARHELMELGLPVWLYEGEEALEQEATEFRTPKYNRIVRAKWILVHAMLELGVEPILVDADIVLVRNPWNYMQDLPRCDLTLGSDSMPPWILENSERRFSYYESTWSWKKAPLMINTGFIWFRNTLATRDLVREFLERPPQKDDQHSLNLLMSRREGHTRINPSPLERRTQCSHYAGVSLNILPHVLFGSQEYFTQFELDAIAFVTPYMIHANYLTGLETKVNLFKKLGLWLVVK